MNMNVDQVLNLLQTAHKGMSQAQIARALEISPQNLGHVLHKRRPPTERILSQLGLEKIVMYRRKKV